MSEQSNQGGLADLLSDETAEETETQSSTDSSTEEDASSTADKSEDLLDLLAEEDETEGEEAEEGQEGSRAQKRIQQLVTQRNEERDLRQSAEEQLTQYTDLTNFLDEVYGEGDNLDAFRTDVGFLKSMLTIANTPGPAQEAVRNLIKTVQDVRDGKLSVNELKKGNNMSTQSSDTPSKGDSAIAREMWADRIDAVLAHPSIPAEVRTLANRLAMQEFDPARVSKTHAQEVVVSILKESGWTPKRSETKSKPPTAPAKRATTNTSTRKADGNSKSEGPKTAREFSALLEEQFNAALLKG